METTAPVLYLPAADVDKVRQGCRIRATPRQWGIAAAGLLVAIL